jgi:hypothetical protein
MGAWEEYLEAAYRLDAVRREAATARATEAATVQDVQRELGVLRQRLGLQRGRLVDISRRAGMPDLQLTEARVASAAADAAGTQAAGAGAHVEAVRAARERIDAADALLSEVDAPTLAGGPLGSWPPARRNAVVYGAFALLVLVLQVILFVAAPSGAASVLAIGCGAVLPIIGFGLAWIGVGLLFQGGGRVDRTPWLGAAISAAPILLLCTGLVTAAVVH